MKRIMLVAIALAFAPFAGAQTLYKHVDKDGKVTYTDQPNATAEGKPVNIPKSALGEQGPAKSFVAQDKELDKKRKVEKEKQAKAGDAEKKEQDAAARCSQARAAFQTYDAGGKIYKSDGSRDLMSDADIEAAREKSRREMDEACKGR